MKIGIYIWRHKDENRYCIGEWNPNKKQYKNLSDLDSAKFRIEQEIKSKDGTSKYAMSDIKIEFAKVLDFYNPDNRQKGFDKLVHQNLKNYFGNSVQVATEFFELSSKWKNHASIFKDAVLKTASNNFSSFNPERPFSYSPRVGSQDLAIDAIVKAAKSGYSKFLLGAKCRFGKTFSSYEAMAALGAKTTLIMTFRPTDTRDAWRSDLNSHQDFRDYRFYTVKEI